MEFNQSRFQDIFSRLYETIFSVIGCLFFVLLISFVFSTNIAVWDYVIFSLVLPFVWAGYLLYKYKNGSKVLRLDAKTFYYRDIDTVSEFAWGEFQGYSVSRFWPYQIIINNDRYGKTVLSYYAFSAKQRTAIFDILDSKCC